MRHGTLIQLVIALAIFAAALGGYAFCYLQVGKLSATAAGLATQIHTKSQESSRIQAAKAALESLSADEDAVRAYLVRTDEIVPFLETLERIGKGFGASVEVVSVSAKPATGRGHLALALKVTGSFDSVLRTLGAIEYGPFDSRVTNLSFDTLNVSGGSPEWTASVAFDIGTRPQAAK